MNRKFILTSTLTFIPYTVIWFFWHNNIFPEVYYASSAALTTLSKDTQNIWAMNFANALLVYGFVYFYFKAVKDDTMLVRSNLWGIYYSISANGFFAFMNFGMTKASDNSILIHELFWAIIGGVLLGNLVFVLYNALRKLNE
jgi:hypothetical protein